MKPVVGGIEMTEITELVKGFKKEIREKAIDELVEAIEKKIKEDARKEDGDRPILSFISLSGIKRIAERLKGGAE